MPWARTIGSADAGASTSANAQRPTIPSHPKELIESMDASVCAASASENGLLSEVHQEEVVRFLCPSMKLLLLHAGDRHQDNDTRCN